MNVPDCPLCMSDHNVRLRVRVYQNSPAEVAAGAELITAEHTITPYTTVHPDPRCVEVLGVFCRLHRLMLVDDTDWCQW